MIQQALNEIKSTIPHGVELCAVSKYHPIQALQEAYDAGQRIFGESHVQELQTKFPQLPNDIEWHFIGHLQTNKVKYIAPYISLIHSVDTEKLLLEINKQGVKNNRSIPILLQLHVAQEDTKYGFTPDECKELLLTLRDKDLQGVNIRGIMCMATNTDDTQRISQDFETAYQFYQWAKSEVLTSPTFSIRSWGMSNDYLLAIQHGSNMIRVGSKIFGPREY